MTAAQIGDNSEKAAKERRVLFGYYHRKDRDIAAKIRELNEQKKSNRQNAKASGFPAAKLDHYLKSFLAKTSRSRSTSSRAKPRTSHGSASSRSEHQGDLFSRVIVSTRNRWCRLRDSMQV